MAEPNPRRTSPLAVAAVAILVLLLIVVLGLVWLRRGARRLSVPMPRPTAPAAPHLPNVPPLPQRPHLPAPIPGPR